MRPISSGARPSLTCATDLRSIAHVALVLGGLSTFGILTTPVAWGENAPAQAKNIAPSTDRIWPVLRRTHIELDFKRGAYVATYPPEVLALVGQTLTIEGFVTPVKAETEFHRFLLSPYAPGCPFCPPADFNEIIDVTVDHAIRAEERLFTVTGKFATQDNGKDGLFFRLDNASVE